MYQLKTYQEFSYEIYELYNSETESWIKVVPERGGIIISFGVKGEEILFLNKETLMDPEKNIRGGIPILFPISGQLENGEYEWNGKTYKMKNHGVARNYPWEVIATSIEENQASITICLKSNSETKQSFPFDFELLFTYTLKDNELIIYQEYKNHTGLPMPMYAGFHPYFQTTTKDVLYQTDAKNYLDFNDMMVKKIEGSLDIAEQKESFVLMDTIKKEISFRLPDRNKTILLNYGEEFKYVVLWTEKDQDFLCVEPWMALTNELNQKKELVMVEPGGKISTFMNIMVK